MKVEKELNLWKKYIPLARAGEPVGAGCFWLFVAGARAAWKKNWSRSRLGKKSGVGATLKKSQKPAKKFAGSPALPLAKSFSRGLKLYVINS